MNLTSALTATILVFHGASALQAQQDTIAQKQLLTSYHAAPVWISMMEDPNVNYYEACAAFDAYWVGREIPAETEGEANALYVKSKGKEKEHEREHEREKKKGNDYKKEEHEDEEGLHFSDPASYQMVYDYKRFTNWRNSMSNKIDPQTGKILSREQLDAIWRNQTQGVDTHIK